MLTDVPPCPTAAELLQYVAAALLVMSCWPLISNVGIEAGRNRISALFLICLCAQFTAPARSVIIWANERWLLRCVDWTTASGPQPLQGWRMIHSPATGVLTLAYRSILLQLSWLLVALGADGRLHPAPTGCPVMWWLVWQQVCPWKQLRCGTRSTTWTSCGQPPVKQGELRANVWQISRSAMAAHVQQQQANSIAQTLSCMLAGHPDNAALLLCGGPAANSSQVFHSFGLHGDDCHECQHCGSSDGRAGTQYQLRHASPGECGCECASCSQA